MSYYELYTLPNCEKCAFIKGILAEEGIEYNEISLGNRNGKRKLGEFYLKISSRLKKDEHGLILPLLLKRNESGIEKIAQEEDKIRKILNE